MTTAVGWSVPSWSDVKAGWSSGWKALSDQASQIYAKAVEVDPTGTLKKVEAFVAALSDSRAALDRMKAKLPNPPITEADRAAVAQYEALDKRYHELAAGFYDDAKPASTASSTPSGTGAPSNAVSPTMGAAPAMLIVGGLAVGAVGVAWAVAAYEYAVNLREQTSLAERELDARVEASRQGRALQPTTLPPQPDPIASATDAAKTASKGVGLLLVGGLVVAAGVYLLPAFLKK